MNWLNRIRYVIGDGIGWLRRHVTRSPFPWLSLAVILLLGMPQMATPARAETVVIIDVGVGEAARRCGQGSYPILERVSGSVRIWTCGQRTQR
jgi:hypothetical protein